MKINDYPLPFIRESTYEGPYSTEYNKEFISYNWAKEDEGFSSFEKGFAIANVDDPHYGLKFNSSAELETFITLLTNAADKVWGQNEK